uniref:Protein ENDOSPERM DEFECTIVE 1 n=1 Tax=Davidia involucrata TaxID=16924 RepID=A0A5B7CAK2_DAVIN
MNETIAEVRPSTLGQQAAAASDSLAPAIPPLPHRRPRVREVSSRFMSPLVSSSGDLHLLPAKSPHPKQAISIPTPTPTPAESPARQQQQRSKSVQRRRQELETLCRADENIPETIRSLETPLGLHSTKTTILSVQRKHRASVKLFKENEVGRAEQQQLPDVSQSQSKKSLGNKSSSSSGRSGNVTTPSTSRPDTPTVTGAAADRIIPSKFRLTTQNQNRRQHPTNSGGCVTAAAKLLQSSVGMSLSGHPDTNNVNWDSSAQEITSIPVNPPSSSSSSSSSSVGDVLADDDKSVAQPLAKIPTLTDSDSCTATATTIQDQEIISTCTTSSSPSVSIQNCKTRSLPDLRSSMPEVDMLPTVSTRLLALAGERNYKNVFGGGSDSSKFSVSPCSRSLNLPLSTSCEHSSSLLYSLKTSEKPASMLSSKPYANSVKMGSLCLPPVAPCMKLGSDAARKGRKVFSHQEEVHSLKLLHNHYLQWRYANAKSEASMHAQRSESERKLYSLGVKISDLRNAVERKRIELGMLQRTKTLSTIIEAHMPHLDEWSALEEEYSTSLSGAIHALLNASLQLPVSGNVQADTREVGEALNSAIKVMEIISFHVQSYMPKAEEMDTLVSELAKVTGGQRALIEECGDLLFRTHTSQVEECSLRGHLIQLQRSNRYQPQE